MQQQGKDQFLDNVPDSGITIMEAIAQAKENIAAMTGLPVDSVVQCRRGEGLNWDVSIDVVEIPARMGDNDLIATYEVEITGTGDMKSFSRLRRYHREDRGA